MSIRPRPFQQATIDAALRTLKRKDTGSARRFLVADEVGLGKTVVASGVIEKMALARRRTGVGPLNVLYVCSNLTIAHQNIQRLLSFIPTREERKSAIGRIDRPTLLPTLDRPGHPLVNVYQLTPGTAIPTRKGQSRDGRMEERALALVLVSKIAPVLRARRLFSAFQRNATSSFRGWVLYYREMANKRNGLGGVEFRRNFREALREVLGLEPGEHLPPRLNRLLEERRDQDLVGLARTALAITALREIGPDLVIFDEFQRFRDLAENLNLDESTNGDGLERTHAAARVMDAIRGDGSPRSPALLLLSATPYTPYRSRLEQHASGHVDSQSSDFFELVKFLANDRPGKGNQIAPTAQRLFASLRDELQKGEIHSERAQQARAELTRLLTPLMARTERSSVAHQAPGSSHRLVEEALHPADLGSFRRMHRYFSDEDRDWIVPLWQSVPLPLQTLGGGYKAWQRKRGMPDPTELELATATRDSYGVPETWPHPKLRSLMSAVSAPAMAMPWSRPSLAWWPLAGGWRRQEGLAQDGDEKLLVFSRYRAIPPALSGLLSYATEARLSGGASYEAAGNPHWLKASSAMLALFHPSPLLASLDPLQAPLGNLRGVRAAVRLQLRSVLLEHGVRIVRKRRGRRRPWELLAALERRVGVHEDSRNAWSSVNDAQDDPDGALAAALERWEEASGRNCEEISLAELEELAKLALEAPGVVLLRSVRRHWAFAADSAHLPVVTDTIWNGLRSYLNRTWFVMALRSGARKYPEALRQAVVDGGLESVLDEHFWYLALESSDDLVGALQEMAAALRLRDANATIHEAEAGDNSGAESFRLRCHLAVPLTDGKASSGKTGDPDVPLRPDEVRRAFNSPFWPRVLVTTSIGQEGLDLHPWCSAMVHWDLAPGPVALEQREGRITRFAGLGVRRAISGKLGARLGSQPMPGSPWARLASMADQELSDPSGLEPWWVLDGSGCTSYVYSTVGSDQRRQHEALNHERALYRLVLGVPDQNDLLNVLKVQLAGEQDQSGIQQAIVDLCPYNLSVKTEVS